MICSYLINLACGLNQRVVQDTMRFREHADIAHLVDELPELDRVHP